jgi:hypothetical protein
MPSLFHRHPVSWLLLLAAALGCSPQSAKVAVDRSRPVLEVLPADFSTDLSAYQTLILRAGAPVSWDVSAIFERVVDGVWLSQEGTDESPPFRRLNITFERNGIPTFESRLTPEQALRDRWTLHLPVLAQEEFDLEGVAPPTPSEGPAVRLIFHSLPTLRRLDLCPQEERWARVRLHFSEPVGVPFGNTLLDAVAIWDSAGARVECTLGGDVGLYERESELRCRSLPETVRVELGAPLENRIGEPFQAPTGSALSMRIEGRLADFEQQEGCAVWRVGW